MPVGTLETVQVVALLLVVAAAQVDELRGGIDVVEMITLRVGAETAGARESRGGADRPVPGGDRRRRGPL